MSEQPVNLNLASDAAAGSFHWLPCKIEYNGVADISDYFTPIAQKGLSGTEVKTGFLRGRELHGLEVPLAPGFSVHRLKLAQGSRDGSKAAVGLSWESIASSSTITYWNHDTAPCSTDPTRRCLDWLNLSAAVHAAVSKEAMELELAAVADGKPVLEAIEAAT